MLSIFWAQVQVRNGKLLVPLCFGGRRAVLAREAAQGEGHDLKRDGQEGALVTLRGKHLPLPVARSATALVLSGRDGFRKKR
jgi:hypothetical protein